MSWFHEFFAKKAWMRVNFCNFHTVLCKLENLTATDILREIRFGNFWWSKIAILVIFGALKFDFGVNSQFQGLKIPNIYKFLATKKFEIAVFKIQKLQFSISRKIWMAEKSLNFHTVKCGERSSYFWNFYD